MFRARAKKIETGPVVVRRAVRSASPAGCTVCPYDASRRLSATWLARLAAVAAVVTVAVGSMHYFNSFVAMEQDLVTAMAHIDRELQRRADLVRGIAPAVQEYAALERRIFTEVAKVRAQQPTPAPEAGAPPSEGAAAEPATPHDPAPPTEPPAAAPLGEPSVSAAEPLVAPAAPAERPPAAFELPMALPGDAMTDLLGHLVAVAEQYPDMKSSLPIKTFMDRVAEIEDRIAAERQKYNDAVNRYTTLRATFPGKLFALVFGFPPYELFRADQAARLPPSVVWPVTHSGAAAPNGGR